MLKKNQIALILLTLVLMLAVYFIKDPFAKEEIKDPSNNPPEAQTSGRLEELTALRLAIREERELNILSLDAIIANNEASLNEKNLALEEKKYLNSLTEKELLLEQQIMNKGYQDAFVHVTDTGIEITVVSNEHSVKIANEIILMAILGFEKEDVEVSVQFQTVEEVMGTAA